MGGPPVRSRTLFGRRGGVLGGGTDRRFQSPAAASAIFTEVIGVIVVTAASVHQVSVCEVTVSKSDAAVATRRYFQERFLKQL